MKRYYNFNMSYSTTIMLFLISTSQIIGIISISTIILNKKQLDSLSLLGWLVIASTLTIHATQKFSKVGTSISLLILVPVLPLMDSGQTTNLKKDTIHSIYNILQILRYLKKWLTFGPPNLKKVGNHIIYGISLGKDMVTIILV